MPKIKSITTFLVSDETSADGFKLSHEAYDEQNNLLLQEQYSPDGSRHQRQERVYNAEGILVEEKHYSTEEQPDHSTAYHYDNAGRVEKEVSTYRDGALGYKNYERDEANRTITIRVLDDKGNEESKEFRRLDGENRMLEETLYAENEALIQRTTRKFDDTGKPLERVMEFPDGFVQHLFYTYELNDQGLLYSVIVKSDKEELLLEDYFEYDERGNQNVHESEDYEKKTYTVVESEYNLDNQLIKQVTFLNEQASQEIYFEYDEHKLLAKREIRTTVGTVIQYNKYEFHPSA